MNIQKSNYAINKYISYYDLLTILKGGKIPYRVKLHINKYSAVYYYDEDNTSYLLENKKYESQRFNDYLIDNFTDKSCFDRIIELL